MFVEARVSCITILFALRVFYDEAAAFVGGRHGVRGKKEDVWIGAPFAKSVEGRMSLHLL